MTPSFDNRRVLILESRRAKEMASIVSSYGGQPVAAPSMKEVPLESNPDAIAFADGELPPRESTVLCVCPGLTSLTVHADSGSDPVRFSTTL